MNRFILLLNHDDVSLTAYLHHCLKRGEQFVKNSGNIFTFTKKDPSDERIAVVTYVNEDPDLKMKFQMEDYSALMKKRGWKVLHIGGPEDIFDSKRHVFLQTDKPDLPMPLTDPGQAEKAKKRESHSLIRCITMLLILLGFAVFFLNHDPDVFLSSDHILFPGIAAFVFWCLSVFYTVRGIVVTLKKSQCLNGFRDFLVIDKAVLFCMISSAALLLSLLLDLFLYPDTGKMIVRGEQRVTVYQDTLPLTMSDLDIPMKGNYHSSRLTVRKGLLMESLHGTEQSFSDPNSTADLSLLSYSVYKSDLNAALNRIVNTKGFSNLPNDENMAERWHSKSVHTDGFHRLSVQYENTLLVFSTSADLSEIDPDMVLEKLINR